MKGSTGVAVVLIGLGVLGVGLALTNRTKDVWDVLLGNRVATDKRVGQSGDDPPAEPPQDGDFDGGGDSGGGGDGTDAGFGSANGGLQYYVNPVGGVGASSGASIAY